jgi:GT2 family glycosyltransferase
MSIWHVVVLSWNGRDDTLACLESLSRIERDDVAVICVDNGSTDGTAAAVRERHPGVILLETGANLGFSGGNNVGIRHALDAGAGWVLLVNNDATVDPGCIDAFEAAARANPRVGALGGKVLFAEPPDLVWFAGQRFWPRLGYSGRPTGYRRSDGPDYGAVREVDRVVGAFMAVSRPAMDAVGLLDEALFAYVEDVEWCLRIRDAGFGVLIVPDARAWHRVSASTGGESSARSLYYGSRNTIAVVERHRPLPRPLGMLRRGVVAATFGAHALLQRDRRAGLAAVRKGVRDARAGRLGQLDG